MPITKDPITQELSWITVQEATPEDHAVCLIYTEKGIGVTRFTEEEGFHNINQSISPMHVYGDDGYVSDVDHDSIKYWVYLRDLAKPE